MNWHTATVTLDEEKKKEKEDYRLRRAELHDLGNRMLHADFATVDC